jgi:EmrB/QacA subfamily drug resistance transporter
METKSQVRVRWVVPVLSVAAFMASLDLFIVNVAFPEIERDLRGSSLADLSWVLNAYAILYAALLVPLGRLADRFGQKAGFLAGLALFTAGSAACAASPSLWPLVLFRGIQAVGAAALTPTSLGLLLTATPPHRRERAVRIWAATGGLAAAAGPVAGGLLVTASWRWVFLVNVPIGVISLVIAARTLPDTRHNSAAALPDLFGGVALLVAIGTLALGLVKAPAWGWDSPRVAACLVLTVAVIAVFWRRSLSHPSPVIEPVLLRVGTFVWSNVTMVAFTVAFAANLLANILWLQQVWHYSALRTGLAIVPGPLMVPLFAALAHRASRKMPAGWIVAAGSGLFSVGTVMLLVSLGADRAYLTAALPGWLVAGTGVGLVLPTILSTATAGLPAPRAATGSAVVNMSRQIGAVLGVSLLVGLIGTPHTYAATHTVFVHARWAIAAAALIGALTALRMTPRTRTARTSPAPDVA